MHKSHSEIRSFYTGLILSDGSIDKGTQNRSFGLSSINKDFVDYIADYTDKYTPLKYRIKFIPANTDKKGVNRKDTWWLYTKSHPYFAKLYHYFYDDYRFKRLTHQSISWLNDPQALANFHMSDGYVCRVGLKSDFIRDCRVDWCTDNFIKDDCIKIAELLTSIGYRSKITQRKTNGKIMYRVRMNVIDAQKFFLDINEFIVPSMKYKLVMPYSEYKEWFLPEYVELMKSLVSVGAIEDSLIPKYLL